MEVDENRVEWRISLLAAQDPQIMLLHCNVTENQAYKYSVQLPHI